MDDIIWLTDDNGKQYREIKGMEGVYVGEYGFKPK